MFYRRKIRDLQESIDDVETRIRECQAASWKHEERMDRLLEKLNLRETRLPARTTIEEIKK